MTASQSVRPSKQSILGSLSSGPQTAQLHARHIRTWFWNLDSASARSSGFDVLAATS